MTLVSHGWVFGPTCGALLIPGWCVCVCGEVRQGLDAARTISVANLVTRAGFKVDCGGTYLT